ERVSGELLRFLVNEDEILAGIRCYGSPSDGTFDHGESVLGSVHRSLLREVRRISNVMMGLPVATIDIVTDAKERSLRRQKYYIVAISERPQLWIFAKASIEEAIEYAWQIV